VSQSSEALAGSGTPAHASAFWRKLARFGAARGPEWWVRYSPAVFGMGAALAVPEARRAVRANLRRIRGERGVVRDAYDVARTFRTYAGCLAEVLSNGSKNERMPSATIHGEEHLEKALAAGTGVILVTAHTAGWEIVGPLMSREQQRPLVMVMAAEADAEARELQDGARRAVGLRVVHIDDPFASLGLLHELRRGAVVALQIDRAPPGLRSRPVTLLGAAGAIPEGPLRLAAASGAPILPIFSFRRGYRSYAVNLSAPVFLPRRPSEGELDAAGQTLADELGRFLRAHPTQWFDFG
jgi:KDO2-lipid IV(A) lauroyltransferase